MIITIRKGTVKDSDLIAQFMYDFRTHTSKYEGDPDSLTLEQCKQTLNFGNSSGSLYYVITHDKTPVGYVYVWLREYSAKFYADKKARKNALVEEIYIIPSERKKGVGTKAMQLVLADLKKQGVTSAEGTSYKQNKPACKMMSNCGFIDAAISYTKKL